jgi:RNA polymerase sigma-70 factor (ECF subfamily)
LSESGEFSSASHFSRLIWKAQQGDKRAFDAIEKECRRQIRSHCIRVLGSESEGEQAAQEAIVKAWSKIGTFGAAGRPTDAALEKCAFESWLTRIATRVCLNIIRINKVKTEDFDPNEGWGLPPDPGFEGEVIDRVYVDHLRLVIW